MSLIGRLENVKVKYPVILDIECTTSNKGNPFDNSNKMVCVGLKWGDQTYIEYDNTEYIQPYIDQAPVLVGFNIKFDLHWLRRIGIDISKVTVWDCQIAEFLLNYQKTPYPSLDEAAEKYGFEKKLDVVKLDYWEKGIDTDKIPREILSEYLTQDLHLTMQVYEKQLEQFQTTHAGMYALFKLQCQDLLVLCEMEKNGIKFDVVEARKKAGTIQEELDVIVHEFGNLLGGVPVNLRSNDHVSCILYGGTIKVDDRIPVGVFKTVAKTGQVRYKIITKEYPLPRLVEPLEGTEVKKPEGYDTYWQVNDTVLRKLKLNKQAKHVVGLLNRYAELEKLRGTYLEGYSNLIDTMNWDKDTLHGTLNQTVAITGRLSSTKPNLQNADPTTKLFMKTRYV